MDDHRPSARKLLGMFILLAFVVVYIIAVLWFSAKFIDPLGPVIQIIFYVIAGVAWSVPAFAIIRWASRARS